MDFFEDFQDTTPVNQQKYQKIVGCLIHLLMVHSEIQLAYLKGTPDLGPTFYTTGGTILYTNVTWPFGTVPRRSLWSPPTANSIATPSVSSTSSTIDTSWTGAVSLKNPSP
jgi:hypothetical protein